MYLTPSITWRGPIFVLLITPNDVDPKLVLGSLKIGWLSTFCASMRSCSWCPLRTAMSGSYRALTRWLRHDAGLCAYPPARAFMNRS